MDPLSPEKVIEHRNVIRSYFIYKEEMKKLVNQYNNDLFSSTIKLDDDRLQSFSEIYTARAVSDTSHLIE